jgi:hypothetical protein
MLYLNQIKPKAFDLWCRILSDDKRNIHDQFCFGYLEVQLRALAGSSAHSIVTSAVVRSCWFNEQVKKSPARRCLL